MTWVYPISATTFFANMVLAGYCAAEQFGFHWSPITHIIIVGCISALNAWAMWLAWYDSPRSAATMYHWRQLALLSIHLLSVGGFLYHYEEYAKFSSRWTPDKVRTAPPHELAVETNWKMLCLAYLVGIALSVPDVVAANDYLRGVTPRAPVPKPKVVAATGNQKPLASV
jgi:hypothetical protein